VKVAMGGQQAVVARLRRDGIDDAHQADPAFLTSNVAWEAIARAGITLLDYRPLQDVWQAVTG
jgi:hypothetical protein